MKKTTFVFIALFVACVFSASAKDPRHMDPSHFDVSSPVDVDSKYEWTPLHWAVRCGNIDEAAALLGRGSKLEARDSLGRTPLHIAALSGHDTAVALLLEHGADVNAGDMWGITPLRRMELVKEIRGWDREKIAVMLVAAGGVK